MGLQISLLGSPRVWRDSAPVAPPRESRTWGLLAYLVLHDHTGAPVPRRHLAAMLFADAHDPRAALRWNLHELRRLLGKERVLGGDPIAVRLAPSDVLDVAVVRSGSWQQAVLIADPSAQLLQGLSFPGCPRFEAWIAAQRGHLRGVGAAVRHESVLARLAAGQTEVAVATAERLVEDDPDDEELQELLVRCRLAVITESIRHDPGVEPGKWTKLGLTWLHAGAYSKALAYMRIAAAAARQSCDPPRLLRALLTYGYGLNVSGGGAEAAIVQHEAMALAARLGDERLRSVAESQFAMTELRRGQYSRALHWAAAAGAHCAGDPVMSSRVCTIRGAALVDTGHYAQGAEELEKAVTGAPTNADPHHAALAFSMLGKARLLQDETGAAIEALDRALDLASSHWTGLLPWPMSLRAEASLRDGQLGAAAGMLHQANALARHFEHGPCWESAAARGLGLLAAARGEVDQAVAWFEDAYRRCASGTAAYQWLRCHALASLCELAVAERLPAAPRWLDELEDQAGRFGMHGFLALAATHRGWAAPTTRVEGSASRRWPRTCSAQR